MVNAKGNNQYGKKIYPSDEALLASFIAYSKENSGAGLSAEDQIARLKQDHGLSIGRDTLFKLRRKVGAPSVRKMAKSMSETEKLQAVIDIKEDDVQGRWGVTSVKQRLANQGVLITRDALRKLLHDQFDEEFEGRFVGKQRRYTHRKPLYAFGPWHQEHSDGHEKLSQQGLNIGEGIELPIYGSKDQFSSFVHALLVLPRIRNQIAIAHYYLDLVESRGFVISMQLITDQGSEVNKMHKIHETLRLEAAPDLSVEEFPPTHKLPSTQNTPIETLWRWTRDGEGHSIKEVIVEGAQSGIFHPQEQLHRDLFYWTWVPLLQHRLDEFRSYWNNHKLTGNKKKENPYGSSPTNMLVNPTSVRINACDCSIRVNPETVFRLRESYGGEEERQKTYRFISEEFQALADGAYVDLGMPEITLLSAWSVFSSMARYLSDYIEHSVV